MASAIEHYRAAEDYLDKAAVEFDEDRRKLFLQFAEHHREMAKVGVMALNDNDMGKPGAEVYAWIQEVGHHEPPSKGPAAMRKAAA